MANTDEKGIQCWKTSSFSSGCLPSKWEQKQQLFLEMQRWTTTSSFTAWFTACKCRLQVTLKIYSHAPHPPHIDHVSERTSSHRKAKKVHKMPCQPLHNLSTQFDAIRVCLSLFKWLWIMNEETFKLIHASGNVEQTRAKSMTNERF